MGCPVIIKINIFYLFFLGDTLVFVFVDKGTNEQQRVTDQKSNKFVLPLFSTPKSQITKHRGKKVLAQQKVFH